MDRDLRDKNIGWLDTNAQSGHVLIEHICIHKFIGETFQLEINVNFINYLKDLESFRLL